MAKKIFVIFMLLMGAVSFFILSGEAFAFSHVLDGNLEDWGVTPFTDWLPSSPGIDYVVEDNTNRIWSDKLYECWDIEAMYFDDDINNIYFAVVSSNPYNNGWAHESLFFDFSGRTYEQILHDNANGYKYAADLCPVPLNLLTPDKKPLVSTRGIYLVNQSKVYEEIRGPNGDKYYFPVSVAITSPYQNNGLVNHSFLGNYEVYNRSWNRLSGSDGDTYVLEGMISKSYFPGECTQPIEMYYSKVTCIKDWITVRGDKDYSCVPEPATMSLFILGGIGMAFVRRKNKA